MPRVVYLSPAQCVISTDKSVMAADGVEVCTVTITAYQTREDGNGEPVPMAGLPASAFTLIVTPSTGVTITQPTGSANAFGTITCSFVSTNAATVALTATVLGETGIDGASVEVGGGAPVDPPEGDPFFTENFTGLAFNNANGFVWGSTNRTSVVNFDGHNCLRFRFPADSEGTTPIAEQRFNMGREVSEIWIEFYIHLPSNYIHRLGSPSNNKFLRLWGNSYNSRSKVGASTIVNGGGATSNYGHEWTRVGSSGMGFNGSSQPKVDYGDAAAMINTWTRVRMHFRHESAPSANDALFETKFGNNAALSQSGGQDNATVYGPTPFWNQGYLLGWANSGYVEETIIHIRDIAFYDTNPGWTF